MELKAVLGNTCQNSIFQEYDEESNGVSTGEGRYAIRTEKV